MKKRSSLIKQILLSPIRKYFIYVLLILHFLPDVLGQPFKQQRCTHRLENALEHVRRRSAQPKSLSRSLSVETPYTLYYSLYGRNDAQEDDYYNNSNRGYYAKGFINHDSSGSSSSSSSSHINIGTFNRNNGNKNEVPVFSGDPLQDEFQQQRQPHKLMVSRVDVEDLQVRMPRKAAARWVEVDKCDFSTENSTLETRLIFPDLTISGKVVLQPTGGKCHMILRLRHAGIEFRTIPIGFNIATNEESRRSGAASVRTDSHFAEPGFISVFAHGCQGSSGIRLRQNSKRRYGFAGEQPPEIEFSEPQVLLGTNVDKGVPKRFGKHRNPYAKPLHQLYDIRSENFKHDPNIKWSEKTEPNGSGEFYETTDRKYYRKHFRYKRDSLRAFRHKQQFHNHQVYDDINFNNDILNFADDNVQDIVQPDARAFAEFLSGNDDGTLGSNVFSATEDRDEVNDAFINELEKLFSMGVRSLLTTYMQRALQPAIKETLMENMGYTLSYG